MGGRRVGLAAPSRGDRIPKKPGRRPGTGRVWAESTQDRMGLIALNRNVAVGSTGVFSRRLFEQRRPVRNYEGGIDH